MRSIARCKPVELLKRRGHKVRTESHRQTDNGIPVRMALFALVLGVESSVHSRARHVALHRRNR